MKKCLRIFSLVMVVVALSSFAVSAYSKNTDKFMMDLWADIDLSYEEEIKPYFYPEIYKGDTGIWYYYNMLYAHYEKNQTEPEYVVFIANTCSWNEEVFVDRYVGDCFIINSEISRPYDLAHYVYVPSLQKVFTLEEAYYSDEIDISAAMKSGRVGIHKADVNLDRTCNIFDVTYIQMHLASVATYVDNGNVDVDDSGNVSIVDATKLQRYLVGLDDSLIVAASSIEA